MMPSPRPRSTRQAQAGLEFALSRVARPNPVVAAWRWRYELATMVGLTAAWTALGTVAGAALTAGLVALLIGTAASGSRGRRFLVARAWCLVTPHRVRIGCAQAWIHSRNGKIPVVLLTTRQPFGERVHLWCRAGTSVDDLSSARGLLAAACWADDIRVSRHPRRAHLVRLDVIRREQPATAAASGEDNSAGAARRPLMVLPGSEPADDGGVGQELDDDMPRRQISA